MKTGPVAGSGRTGHSDVFYDQLLPSIIAVRNSPGQSRGPPENGTRQKAKDWPGDYPTLGEEESGTSPANWTEISVRMTQLPAQWTGIILFLRIASAPCEITGAAPLLAALPAPKSRRAPELPRGGGGGRGSSLRELRPTPTDYLPESSE